MTPARTAIAAGLLLVASVAGCAPSLSTFQPAHVAPKGHLSASAGLEGNVPVGAFETLVDDGKNLAQQGASGQALTDDQKWKIFDAGVNLLLLTPSVTPHFALTYVPIDHLELGVRYAGDAWRGGVRYQLLDHVNGPFDFTVGVGVSRYTFEFPIKGSYPAIRAFVDGTLQKIPAAGLSKLTVERKNVADANVNATVGFTVYLRPE